jgi:hypothetical protein
MPKLTIAPGVKKDQTPLQVGLSWQDTNLMRFHTGNIEPIGGWTPLTASLLTGVCRSIHEWSTLSGTDLIAFGTNSRVFVYSSGVLYDITPVDFVSSGGGPVDATVATGYGIGPYGMGGYGVGVTSGLLPTNPFDQIILEPLIWSLDNFGEDLILNPHADIFDPGHLYIWHPSGGFSQRATLLSADTSSSDVPEWAGGMFVSTQSEQVVAFGTPPFRGRQPDPMQIRWSDIANPYDWTPTSANSAGDYRLPSGSEIIGICQGYFETLFFCDSTIYTMTFTGTNSVFAFNPISSGISMIAPKAAVSTGSTVYWMDQGAFYQYNGSVTELDSPVKEFVFGNINRLQRFKIHAAHNHQFGEIWWYYPSIVSTEIDSYICYNYRDSVWTNGLLNRTAWSDTGRNISPIATDENGAIWLQEIGDSANGSPLLYSATTGDIDTNDGETFTTLWRMIADILYNGTGGAYQSILMDVRTKRTSNDPYLVAKTIELNNTDNNNGLTDIKVRGRRISLKFYNNNDNFTSFILGKCQVEFVPSGRR